MVRGDYFFFSSHIHFAVLLLLDVFLFSWFYDVLRRSDQGIQLNLSCFHFLFCCPSSKHQLPLKSFPYAFAVVARNEISRYIYINPPIQWYRLTHSVVTGRRLAGRSNHGIGKIMGLVRVGTCVVVVCLKFLIWKLFICLNIYPLCPYYYINCRSFYELRHEGSGCIAFGNKWWLCLELRGAEDIDGCRTVGTETETWARDRLITQYHYCTTS